MRKFIILTSILFLIYGIIVYSMTPKVEYWTYHTVDAGDTLWDIGKQYNPDYGWNDDVISKIKHENGLRSSYIYCGDILKVPVMEVD